MAERYPKRKLSTEEISRALNFESDSDDSNDKLFEEQSLMKCLIWMNILHQFMKGRNHSNVTNVNLVLIWKKDLNVHIASVHEGKKPYRCQMCDINLMSKIS